MNTRLDETHIQLFQSIQHKHELLDGQISITDCDVIATARSRLIKYCLLLC